MLWWLKMSNISARNSRATRSVTAKDLPRAKSAFHAPGPLKAFLPVMFAGKGPNVSTQLPGIAPRDVSFCIQTELHVSLASGRIKRLNSLGLPVEVEVSTEKLPIV